MYMCIILVIISVMFGVYIFSVKDSPLYQYVAEHGILNLKESATDVNAAINRDPATPTLSSNGNLVHPYLSETQAVCCSV